MSYMSELSIEKHNEIKPWTAQQFKSPFQLQKAKHAMKAKGFAVRTESTWCGVTTVTWRKT